MFSAKNYGLPKDLIEAAKKVHEKQLEEGVGKYAEPRVDPKIKKENPETKEILHDLASREKKKMDRKLPGFKKQKNEEVQFTEEELAEAFAIFLEENFHVEMLTEEEVDYVFENEFPQWLEESAAAMRRKSREEAAKRAKEEAEANKKRQAEAEAERAKTETNSRIKQIRAERARLMKSGQNPGRLTSTGPTSTPAPSETAQKGAIQRTQRAGIGSPTDINTGTSKPTPPPTGTPETPSARPEGKKPAPAPITPERPSARPEGKMPASVPAPVPAQRPASAPAKVAPPPSVRRQEVSKGSSGQSSYQQAKKAVRPTAGDPGRTATDRLRYMARRGNQASQRALRGPKKSWRSSVFDNQSSSGN